ncbi:MAG: alkaline phosphatase D family protein [Limnospira sp.]
MLTAKDLYSESFYLANNPDVELAVEAGIIESGFEHFLETGQFQVRQPTPLYDEFYYLATNPDVAQAVNSGAIASGFQHFINAGQFERRDPGILFDTAFYLEEYPFLESAILAGDVTAIEHFVKFGQFADFRPSSLYNPDYYQARNPDVAAKVARGEVTGIEHYLEIGAAQGRDFSPFLEPDGSNFPNRVASGDTTQTGTTLMARSTVAGPLTFETAIDPNFTNIVSSVTTTALDPTLPSEVSVSGLTPGTQYFYRVTNARGESDQGSFRTSKPLGVRGGLRFGATGDGQGELMPHAAVGNVPERNLDFFAVLGNTISADTESPDLPGVRQAVSWEEFRTKHNEIYSRRLDFNPWGNLRASTSILPTWNDRELTENFAGGTAPILSPQTPGLFGTGEGLVNNTPVFEAALQGFLDYNPRAAGEELYRAVTFGDDAAAFLLDVRSFRDAPLPQVSEAAPRQQIDAFLAASFDRDGVAGADRTMLGRDQLERFQENLLASEAAGLTWKFIFSPVPMQNLGIPGAADRWEGYAAERSEILKFIDENDIDNVVFVSAGLNGTVVNNLTYQEQFGGRQIPVDAMEITVGPAAVQADLGDGLTGAPLGPATVANTPEDVLTREAKAVYDSLETRSLRDAFIQDVFDSRLVALGYDPVGLQGSGIDAQEVIPAPYVAVHTFGWTEFVVDENTRQLLVTTYGVEPYSQIDVETVPAQIIGRQPEVVSQFLVNPELF